MKDVFIISFPKCGRTWLTMILARIFQKEYNLPEGYVTNIESISDKLLSIPKIRVFHEDNPQNKKSIELLKDKTSYKNNKIILLIRDPRDVIVSWYFHEKNRKKRYNGKLNDFLFKGFGDFNTIIKYYNIWSENMTKLKNILILRYEDLTNDSLNQIKRVLEFMNIKNISNEKILESLEFSKFDNMQKMESDNKFNVNRLKPGDKKDMDSFKIRKGKIGGYKDYLNTEEIQILNKKMISLNKIYGYNVSDINPE